MSIKSFFRAARRRWISALVTLLLVVGAAAALTALTPRVYQSSTETMITAAGGSTNSDRVSGSTYAQTQMPSYMEVATSQLVLGPVIAALDLDTTPEALAGRVSVDVAQGTSVITVAASAPTADDATRLASEVTGEFVETVERMETPPGGSESNIEATVIREAITPTQPTNPVVWRNMALAVVVGLVLGLLVALLRERADPAVRSAEEAEEISALPLLGRVPAESKKDALTLGGVAGTPRVEAFTTLRTNLRFLQTAGEGSAFVFTSARPGEGKTSTIAHLVDSLATGTERVLVIDADLRRPKLARYLGLVEDIGLTNVLIGSAELEDAAQPYGDSDVWILSSGPIPPNPVELLASSAMSRLVEEAKQAFDVVIIDAPPVLPVSDAVILGEQAGTVVLVVSLGVAQREDIPRTVETLRRVGANVAGLVVNRVPALESTNAYVYTADPQVPAARVEPAPRTAPTAAVAAGGAHTEPHGQDRIEQQEHQ